MRAGQQYQRIPEDELVGRGLELGSVPHAGEAELPSLFPHRQRTSSSSLGSAAEDPSIAPTATAYDSTLLSRTTPLRAPASGASGSRGASTSLWCGFFVLVVAVTGALLSMFKLTMDLQSQVVLLTTNVRSLEQELTSLRSESRQEYGTVSDDLLRIESNYTRVVSALDGRIDGMNTALTKLTNRTTNAEVLEQLHRTREFNIGDDSLV